MYTIINEGNAELKIAVAGKISKEMPVFYNPVMKLNRDISVLLLNSVDKKGLQIADPLAGTGVRSIRFLLELKKNKIKAISINDYSKEAVRLIKENLKLNKIKLNNKIIIKNEDANIFLLSSTGFDYIDIDPFGSPNFMLDSAVKRLARDGILAVTATDTAPLCGTYPTACLRKYWAIPLRNELMHEIGLRILIKKIQLIGAQYEKALTPIFSYYKYHYFRVFLRCEKGKKDVDKVIEQHGMFENAGPLWLGPLFDKLLVKKINKMSEMLCISEHTQKSLIFDDSSIIKKMGDKELVKLLSIIKNESKINTIGFYDIHEICKKYKIKQIPKKESIIKKIKKSGYKAAETHFNPNGIRSDIPSNKLLRIIQ